MNSGNVVEINSYVWMCVIGYVLTRHNFLYKFNLHIWSEFVYIFSYNVSGQNIC